MKPINSLGDSHLSSTEIKFCLERLCIQSIHRSKYKSCKMTQNLIRLRCCALKVIQSRAHRQSHAVIQQLHPLKPKPSLHTTFLWLPQHKPVLGFQGVASRVSSYFVATFWKLSLSVSSPQTLGGTSNCRGAPWKDPVKNAAVGTAAMLYRHTANSFHHCQYLSST